VFENKTAASQPMKNLGIHLILYSWLARKNRKEEPGMPNKTSNFISLRYGVKGTIVADSIIICSHNEQ
jgi:hypothetical protein